MATNDPYLMITICQQVEPDSTILSNETGEAPVFPAYSQYGPIEDALPLIENMFDDNTQTRISPRFAGNPNIGTVIETITAAYTGEYIDSSQNTDKASMVTRMPRKRSAYVSEKLIGERDIKPGAINICKFEPLQGAAQNNDNKKPKEVDEDTYDSDGWLNIDPVCK